MDIYYKKQRSIASLFTRFIIGFGAGFAGMISLGIVFSLTQNVLGDFLQSSDELKNSLGSTIGQIETNPLLLIFVVLAIFIATLVTTLAYVFLSLLVEEHYTKRATTLTHVFYGNVILLILMIPLYIGMNEYFETTGIVYMAFLHAFLVCFFSIFVLQTLHQVKYVLVNLYGNILGVLFFVFVAIIALNAFDKIVLVFLAFPFFMGIMAFSNRFVELFYAFLYTKTGIDMLNIETTFGDDYGVQLNNKDFDEDDEFEKEFKV